MNIDLPKNERFPFDLMFRRAHEELSRIRRDDAGFLGERELSKRRSKPIQREILLSIWNEIQLADFGRKGLGHLVRVAFSTGCMWGAIGEKFELEPLTILGMKFSPAYRKHKRRMDALSKILIAALPATNREVLRRLAPGDVIEQVDRNSKIVYWNSRGTAKETTFKAIENRLTTLRKKIPSEKNHK